MLFFIFLAILLGTIVIGLALEAIHNVLKEIRDVLREAAGVDKIETKEEV